MAIRKTTRKPKKRGPRKKRDAGSAPNWLEFLAW